MALQSVRGGLTPIFPLDLINANMRIDASGEKLHMVFAPPKNGNIDRVGFLVNAVTSSETLRAGLYTVNLADGLPTTTAYGGMTVGTVTPVAGTFHEVTLGTAATADIDDVCALGIEFDSAVGNVDLAAISSAANSGFPYIVLNGAKNAGSMPQCAVRYDDGLWYPVFRTFPVQSVADVAFGNGSTPDERALIFREAFPRRLIGVEFIMALSTGADFEIVLDGGAYSSVVLRAHDGHVSGSTAAGRIFAMPFETARELAANTDYYLSIRPSSATTLSLRQFVLSSAGVMDALWAGQNAYLATRTNGGAWGTDTAIRPAIRPIYDQFDDGAGGGAVLAAGNLLGGLFQ